MASLQGARPLGPTNARDRTSEFMAVVQRLQSSQGPSSSNRQDLIGMMERVSLPGLAVPGHSISLWPAVGTPGAEPPSPPLPPAPHAIIRTSLTHPCPSLAHAGIPLRLLSPRGCHRAGHPLHQPEAGAARRAGAAHLHVRRPRPGDRGAVQPGEGRHPVPQRRHRGAGGHVGGPLGGAQPPGRRPLAHGGGQPALTPQGRHQGVQGRADAAHRQPACARRPQEPVLRRG